MQAEAQEYISSCDCPTYLAHAEKRLGEEAERVQNYLDAGSEPRVIRVRG
jgi:cullin 3